MAWADENFIDPPDEVIDEYLNKKNMNDPQFVDGMIAKKPHENAPDFIKCALAVKRKELIEWLENHGTEWINIDVKESKKGSWYAQVNDYKPQNQEEIPTIDLDNVNDNLTLDDGTPVPF